MLKLRPVHRHGNGPTWEFPGRPAVSVHQALAGSCGGSSRARQTSHGRAGWRAHRMAGPSQAAPGAGHCHRVVASWCCHLLGMGLQPSLLGSLTFAAICSFRENRRSTAAFPERPGRERRPAPQRGRPVRPRCGPAGSGAARAAVRTGWRRISAASASDVHVQTPEAADYPP